jgi:hypothetical protein
MINIRTRMHRFNHSLAEAAYAVINAVAPEMEEWDSYDDETCASIIVDQMDAHGDMAPELKETWAPLTYVEKMHAVMEYR